MEVWEFGVRIIDMESYRWEVDIEEKRLGIDYYINY